MFFKYHFLLLQMNITDRNHLNEAHRIVVKFGTRILVDSKGRPDITNIKKLISQVAELSKRGKEIIIVSSGAIACGMEALGISRRPRQLSQLQMAASVGQVRLISHYENLLSQYEIKIAQVLLTHDDLRNRTRHLNARNTLLSLLRQKIVPIINENDAVSNEEIKFGDNDLLASLVSLLIDADLLIILSMTDGLLMPTKNGSQERVSFLKGIPSEALRAAMGKNSDFSVGGMKSKLLSSKIFLKGGGAVIIGDGRGKNILQRIISGKDVGTLIVDKARPSRNRKEWIGFFSKSQGTIVVDEGAQKALRQGGKSVLPIGIKEVKGVFGKGSVISIESIKGDVFARGLTSFSSDEIEKIKGEKSCNIQNILGHSENHEVVHCDNLIIFE